MDIGTGLVILGSAELMAKLLGPTFEYFGEGLKSYTQRGLQNVERILEIGMKRLGSKIDEPGQIPPKVFSRILREGPFTEDELTSEYFGGILAASRSKDSKDDRGSYYLDIISRLTSYQIRAHYIVYAALKNTFNGSTFDLALGETRATECRIFIPTEEYTVAMGFEKIWDAERLMHHLFDGVSRELLIELDWAYGDMSIKLPGDNRYLKEYGQGYVKREGNSLIYGRGLALFPAGLGIELFIRAHGHNDIEIKDFLNKDVVFPKQEGIIIPRNCKHVPVMLQQRYEDF